MLTVGLAVAGYVVGSMPWGYWLVRIFRGEDIRTQGSGNIGATNVLRTAGRLPALLTLLLDIAKGYAAVWVGGRLAGGDPAPTAACALATVVGNCWSIFLGFRGGKGVATGLGALLGIVRWAVVPAIPVWLAVALTTRYVSLGSILGAVCVPLGALLLGYPRPFVLASLVVSALIIARHRENVTRLLAGTERKLGERRSTA